MAKVQPSDLFTSISGKLCSKEGTYIALNKQTGKMYSAVHHRYSDTNTEAQQAVKAAFAARAKFATKWWKANSPSTENPQGSESYKLVMKAYKVLHKIDNRFSYLRTLVTDDLTVKLGDLYITGDVSAPSAGGGSGVKPGSGGGSSAGGPTEGEGGDA